jgi:hypothetical protein
MNPEELDAAIVGGYRVPGTYVGRPPGDPPDCTCFHCCVADGLDPDRLRLHEAGFIDMWAEIEAAVAARALR